MHMLLVEFRLLATGETFRSIAFSYRDGATTVDNIVCECAEVPWDCLAQQYIKMPQDEEEWRLIAANFKEKWQLISSLHCRIGCKAHHYEMSIKLCLCFSTEECSRDG